MNNSARPIKALFISDLHLRPEQPAVAEAFFDFLDQRAIHAEALYILGDLFEAWWGDDNPDPLPRRIIAALKQLSQRGVALYFIHGNRDFAIGKRFSEETGCTLLSDAHHIDVNGKRILLMHGDTLCSDDISYQKYRRIIRKPLLLSLLGNLPQKIRRNIAEKGRAKSQQSNNNKAEYIMDVNAETVKQQFIGHAADIMIHGHTHRPGRHAIELGDAKGNTKGNAKTVERIVLGDWTEQRGWLATLTDAGDVALESFVIHPGE